jgi:2-keto-4-pentenoate hydratase/2-oxohepta-3-ene-1,7-dioic acid hydratase in catechol pathway
MKFTCVEISVKLVAIGRQASGHLGAVLGEEVLDLCEATMFHPLASWLPRIPAGVVAADDAGLAFVEEVLEKFFRASEAKKDRARARDLLTPYTATPLKAPLQPAFILCMGRAYPSHREEMIGAAAAATERGDPAGFIQSVHCLNDPGGYIRIPPQAPDMVDFEGELAVVFGRRCHNVSAKDAMDYLFGFTVANDISARNWIGGGDPSLNDKNRMGKQFPTFFPIGPTVVSKDEFANPLDLHLVTRVNGAVMQDVQTSQLVCSIPEMIEYFSSWYTFGPGDILSTGTPGGVGFGRKPKVFLRAGDVVSVTIDGIGTLENTVVASNQATEAT